MADILIKGMEMPKSCDVCPFVHENDDLMSDDYRFLDCGFPGMGMFVTDYIACRHPDCQLHELPPHGQLIDADKLEKAEEWRKHGIINQETVNAAPTIIPESEER